VPRDRNGLLAVQSVDRRKPAEAKDARVRWVREKNRDFAQ